MGYILPLRIWLVNNHESINMTAKRNTSLSPQKGPNQYNKLSLLQAYEETSNDIHYHL